MATHASRQKTKRSRFKDIILAPPLQPKIGRRGTAQQNAIQASVPPFEQVAERQATSVTYVTPFPETHSTGVGSSVFNGGATWQQRAWYRRRFDWQFRDERLSDTNPWITGQHRVWIPPPNTAYINLRKGLMNPKLKWGRTHKVGEGFSERKKLTV